MSKKIIVLNDRFDQNIKNWITEETEKYGYTSLFFDTEEEAMKEVSDAEIIYGYGIDLVKAAKNLKWLHMPWAGVDGYLKSGVVPENVLFSNSSGTYGVTIAEHIIMLTTMMFRNEVAYVRGMDKHQWIPPMSQHTIKNCRITLLGAGDIGTATAKRLRAFEPATLNAVNRSGREVDPVFDAIYRQDHLGDVLPETDLLIMSLPSTDETRGILNKETINMMPKGSFVINVGRGTCVVEKDVADALISGQLAGASLDVFNVEPLPENSPLWKAPNFIMTPHVAGNLTAPYTTEKNVSMFLEDFKNYCEGKSLKYAIDRKLGY